MRKKAIFLMMALALASTPAMLAQEAADTTFVFNKGESDHIGQRPEQIGYMLEFFGCLVFGGRTP